jgi:hypothetical protein
MKTAACLIAGLALCATGVRAEDKDKVEVQKDANHAKIEKKHKRGHTTDTTKVESSAHKKLNGGTVSKTETTVDHDRPGISKDAKSKTTETVERDANGNVIRHEKKTDH